MSTVMYDVVRHHMTLSEVSICINDCIPGLIIFHQQSYLQTEKQPEGEEQDQSPKLAGCGGQQQLQGQKTCSSKCCKVVADTFISKMNQKIDPCDDFYQFACGKWIEETELTDGKMSWAFGAIEKKLNEQVRSIVLSISSSTS